MNWPVIKNALEKLTGRFLDVLFPIECLGCGRENEWLCPLCQAKIKLKTIDQCVVCKEPTVFGQTHRSCQEKTALDGVIVAAEWEDKLLQEAIHKYKYSFVKGLAEPLAQILIKKITPPRQAIWAGEPQMVQLLKSKNIILAPIPLHRRRLNWRGFNQAELLAERIGREFGWPIMPLLMRRNKYTKPQAKLKKEEREKNLQGVFGMSDELEKGLKDKTVLLIDDIITTGTTMNECAKILKEAGAKEVWGAALARG
ncbi:ComF family protein [Candidatus Kuenenbacteria bacterium]|nr:ComF family protein [Candidatus Kuenenbacteria bacterium]